jgi:DNA mismatch repair protein MSH4
VLEAIQSGGAVVPNDVFCDDSSSFQIVQGPKCVLSSLCFIIVLFAPDDD